MKQRRDIPAWSRRRFGTALGLWTAALTAGAGLAGGAGCSVRRAALPQRTYLLQAPPAGPATEGEAGGVLLVRPVRVAPAFDSRAFVVRRGGGEFATDAYHGFLLSPGSMLTEVWATWVRGLGVFREVTTGGSLVAPSHALEADVVELCGDYREATAPKAVLEVTFRLLHPLGQRPGVVWQRTRREVVPLRQAGAEELVAGWNEAVAATCRSLDAGLFRRPARVGEPQARFTPGVATSGHRV